MTGIMEEIFEEAKPFIGLITLAGIIGLSSISMGYCKGRGTAYDEYLTKQIQTPAETQDLDGNGLTDLIISRGDEHLTPMFAVEEDGRTIYITGKEMLERNPASIVDYGVIEYRLNE